MKLLLIGSGGREHALAWVLRRSPHVTELFCYPGSDALDGLGTRVPPAIESPADLAVWARTQDIRLTVVGPEAPLAAGLADAFRERELAVVGPSAAAARLESSKIFAKDFMRKHGVPTARYRAFDRFADAADFVRHGELGFPVVIKADGLAAGKGVSLCPEVGEATAVLERLMQQRQFGDAGARVLVEECLRGEELSYMVLCDGRRHEPLAISQDHKKLLDGDQGPNTGGMGSYSCDDILSPETRAVVEERIVQRTLAGLREEGLPYQGVLYAGLMLTEAGPQVLEFNVRLGDPETQAIVMRFDGDLAQVLLAAAEGRLGSTPFSWHPGAALCVVVAAAGYPENPRRGDVISGLEMAGELEQVQVFHAGTRRSGGAWETAGGRVLGVTALGSSLSEASIRAYEAVNRIHFAGMQYRRDIGSRGLRLLRERREEPGK